MTYETSPQCELPPLELRLLLTAYAYCCLLFTTLRADVLIHFYAREFNFFSKLHFSVQAVIIKASEKVFHTIMPSPKLMESLPTQNIDLHIHVQTFPPFFDNLLKKCACSLNGWMAVWTNALHCGPDIVGSSPTLAPGYF